MTKIAVFVGSLREGSLNKQLAKAIEGLLPEDATFDYVEIGDLPLFNSDLEADYPATAQRVKDQVEAADGVLFVTPEYNRGVPGVLKNATDWASRPWGTNSFAGKPVAVVGAGGQLGTALAQGQLRSVLTYLDTRLMGQPEVYISHAHEVLTDAGIDERTTEHLQHFVEAFLAHIAR